MSFVHPPAGANDWEGSLPLGSDGPSTQPVIENALAHLDAISPDMSLILRQMMTTIQRQNQQLARLQTEMNDHFSRIGTRLDLVQQQTQQQHVAPIAPGFDAQNASGSEHAGNKRPASPSNQTYPFPAAKHPRTERASNNATNNPTYFDPSQPQFNDNYGIYGIAAGQRVPDLDPANPNSSFLEEGAANGTPAPSSNDPKAAPPKPIFKQRDRPPKEYYTSDETFMDRGIRTLHDLWKEYTVGWNGKPSVKSMNQMYGTRWHYQPKEALYWGIRRHVYKHIEELRDKKYNGDVDAAIKHIEARMERDNITSIHKLGQALRLEKGEVIRRPGKNAVRDEPSTKGLTKYSRAKASQALAASAASAATDYARRDRDADETGVDEDEDEDESQLDTALRSGAAAASADATALESS